MTPPARDAAAAPRPHAPRRTTATSSASISRRPRRSRRRARPSSLRRRASLVLGGGVRGRLPAARTRERAALAEATAGRRPARRCGSRSSRRRSARATARCSLPGSVQPLEETVALRRARAATSASGYVDIGDKVTDGQLLAEIETPELDQELDQARAQLAPGAGGARAGRRRTASSRRRTSQRYKQLTPAGRRLAGRPRSAPGAGAGRRGERRASRRPTIAAQEANIRRLTQLKAFARVTAPFAARSRSAGSRSARSSPPATGSRSTGSRRLDPARVFVQVPQDVAPASAPTCRPR